jgi:transposase-like protein
MDEYRYNCNYCGVEYTPRRRHVQKYCCSSCRVNAFNQRKTKSLSLPSIKKPEALPVKDQMSLSGIGNAAVGALAIDLATSLFTREENKPATKGDIEKILQGGIHKTILIRNIPPRMDGARAYFDTQQQILIYKK